VEVRLAPVATAVAWAAVAARLGADPALPAFLVLSTVLVAVAAIDLRHYVVPNRIVAPALGAGLVLLVGAAALTGEWGRLGSALLGAVAGFNALLLIHLVQPRGMGLGDVKLAGVLGLHLGWFGLGHVVVGLFLGFGLGAVVGLALVAAGRRSRRDHVPFAPFLAAGTLLAVVVGAPILRWYGGL
jgi:leader peptidase (prepilin peptidase)/N-methyltransferase